MDEIYEKSDNVINITINQLKQYVMLLGNKYYDDYS